MAFKNEPNNVTVAFALPKGLLEEIQADAKKEDRKVSYILRKIIAKHYRY